MCFNPPRGESIVNEVAQSRNSRQIAFTGSSAYGSNLEQAQDDNHDYEVLPLQQLPLPIPAQATDPSTSHEMNEYIEATTVTATHEDSTKGTPQETKRYEHLYDTASTPLTSSMDNAEMCDSSSQDTK